MSVKEIHDLVMELPEDERAKLAGNLLASLPAVLSDDDDGLAEARRRSKELDDDPIVARTWDEIERDLGR